MTRLRIDVHEPSVDGVNSSTRYVKNLEGWLDRQAGILAPGSLATIHKGTGGTWQMVLRPDLADGYLWAMERETFTGVNS